MAAPTNVRVEAQSQTSAIIRWTYAGVSGLSLYRSTDGAIYTLITQDIPFTSTSYTDLDLDPGTKYWYKLSDDLGSTFSSVVTVWSHGCLVSNGGLDTLALPRFDGADQQADDLNNMAERIEEALGGRVLSPEQCIACPEDGAVVIDCSDGCKDWIVVADEDINSISVQWCEGPPGTVEFIIPPNTTNRRICGWPAGFGFTGDECTQAPITTGAFGTSIGTSMGGAGGTGGGSGGSGGPSSRRGYNLDTRSGGGSGGSGCTCVPGANGALTIKSCSPNNSLSCTSSKSLKLLVCGGRGPYVWSRTGSVNLKGANQATAGAAAAGTAITVTPPTNAGSGVAGTAYSKTIVGIGCGHTVGTTHGAGNTAASYGCNDNLLACPDLAVAQLQTVMAFLDSACSCGTHSGHAVSGAAGVTTVSCTNSYGTGAECTAAAAVGAMLDVRTAPMIAASCSPCGLNEGATVSVTDTAGVTTTIILKS
jgi:hypothetical protein